MGYVATITFIDFTSQKVVEVVTLTTDDNADPLPALDLSIIPLPSEIVPMNDSLYY